MKNNSKATTVAKIDKSILDKLDTIHTDAIVATEIATKRNAIAAGFDALDDNIKDKFFINIITNLLQSKWLKLESFNDWAKIKYWVNKDGEVIARSINSPSLKWMFKIFNSSDEVRWGVLKFQKYWNKTPSITTFWMVNHKWELVDVK